MHISWKRLVPFITALFATLCLASCSNAEEAVADAQPVDMEAIYEQMTALEDVPDMVVVPADKAVAFFGIAAEDCAQSVTAICQDSLRADELWLVEAVDSSAADRIEALAQTRLDQKSAELKNYSPEQYEVVQAAKLLRDGNYIVLIVSPQAETMADIFASSTGTK